MLFEILIHLSSVVWPLLRPFLQRRLSGLCIVALLLCGCAGHGDKSNERVTGSGGQFLKYSSKQTTVDPTAEEKKALADLQNRTLPRTTSDAVVAAAVKALSALKFDPITPDPGNGLVEAELHEKLASKGREILVGLLKQKGFPMRAKPDHQSTYALVVARAASSEGVAVHVEFKVTVWDSNGDATTKTRADPEIHTQFFTGLTNGLVSPAAE